MKRKFIKTECCLAYTILALHNLYHSANKEFKIKEIVEEIETLFSIYTNENEAIDKMNKILKEEGEFKITFCIEEERIGITIAECAELLGISKQLMSEIVREPGFPCLKFKRRILINKNKVQEWFNSNSGRKIKY